MSHDKKHVGKPDRSRINTNEEYEVKYWPTKFVVSTKELINAVEQVGSIQVM